MTLDDYRPDLVYEEKELGQALSIWLVVSVKERTSTYVCVTELELVGHKAGNVASVSISSGLAVGYTLIAAGAP